MEFDNCKVCGAQITIENVKFNLVRCNSCELIFSKSQFSQSEFEAAYKKLYNKSNEAYSRHSEVEYNDIKRNKINIGYNRSLLLKKYVLNKKCKSVLEIGSGIGLFGAYIRRYDKGIDYLGIELDKGAYLKSQELQLNTLNGDFSLMQKVDKKFDVIMLWEVIEHLQDLKLFLKLANNRLNHNGLIILSTPNYNKIYNYPNRKKDDIFQDIPPVHLNFFTLDNINSVFSTKGFKTLEKKEKKFPYFTFRRSFWNQLVKSLFGRYNGSTIYFAAQKVI